MHTFTTRRPTSGRPGRTARTVLPCAVAGSGTSLADGGKGPLGGKRHFSPAVHNESRAYDDAFGARRVGPECADAPSVESATVILSDRSINEALAAGRIVIYPLDERDVQPSSVDLRIDRYFRVFRNDTTPYIDPKQPQEDLTEIVEVSDGGLHPPSRRVRARLDLRAGRAARRPRRAARGQELARSARPAHPLDRRASSTRAGTATSRSSCRTSPTCRSRSTRG